MKILHSSDGIEWQVYGTMPIPKLHGMDGLDTMPSLFFDPGCACIALFTRLWHDHHGADADRYRMVRRANLQLVNSSVSNQAVVLQADAIDSP